MKETSRSLLFSFPARECAQKLCDASDCFHTLHRLRKLIKKKRIFTKKKKILYSKDLEFTHHSKITKRYFYKKKKIHMPLMRLITHLGKVKTNPSNYYILNKKQLQL